MFCNRFSQRTYRYMAFTLSLTFAFTLLWLLSGIIAPVRASLLNPASTTPLAPNTILTVTNADDNGPGSLRQAIADAVDGDIINFDNYYSIYLSSTLNIAKRLTIDGGNNAITLSGAYYVQVFNIGAAGVVTLSHLNIVSGSAMSGGGIYNTGWLKIISSTISDNGALSNGNIVNDGGTLSLIGSAVSNGNSTDPDGNAIANYNGGWALVADSQIVNNPGAIWTVGGTLVITNSVIMSNANGYSGAGIHAVNNSTVIITNSTVSGNTSSQGGGLSVDSSTVELDNVTIANNTASNGGGIYANGNLTLNHVTVMSNTASNNGGGIYNAGTLRAQDSLIQFNAADNSACGLYNVGTADFLATPIEHNYAPMPIGGGIYNSGWLRIISGTVGYNTGMGFGNIWNNGGTLSLIGSTVHHGSSTGGGNAIANFNGGWALVADSQIIDNPGAIQIVDSTTVITNSVIMSNVSAYYGAGINAVNSTVIITNSTVSGNFANSGRGGGLSIDSSSVDLDNVTIANNTAAYYSGGASGGGLYIASGTVNARNTIIAGNHDTGSDEHHPDCSGVLTSQGYDLIGDTTGCTISGTLTRVISNTAPLLGDLQDNGGSTWTMALLSGSPAIDAGDDVACPPIDQRGVSRPQGLHCDMGAYEYQSTPISYTLTVVAVGNGSGLVTYNPIGPTYVAGTIVTLTATPLISSTFAGWSGDVITGTNPVTLTMDANKTVTATFVLNTLVITPTASANGSITPSTPQTVNYGASQTFMITPNANYHIGDVGVDGVSQGTLTSYTFNNVTANHTISAAFAINIYTLTVNYAGNGLGSVLSTPPGPSYTAGTVITLTAVPSLTSRFTGWSGSVISTTNPLILTMDGNKSITATFVTYRVYLPLTLK